MSEATVPTHVGFIMDGNRRWAKAKGKMTLEGHAAGQSALRDAIKHAVERGVKYISAYAFSTENWSRSENEVSYLMKQVARALKVYIKEFLDNDIKIVIVGTREGLSDEVLKSIDSAEAKTAHCQRATAAICFNYGGHREIVDAVRSLQADGVDLASLTEEDFSKHIYHPEIPPIDLVIRTSGEQRLSNFMLWRSAYSELIFRDEYWPDFSPAILDECLDEYAHRQRRFGG